MTPGTSRPSPTQKSTACDGSALSGTPPEPLDPDQAVRLDLADDEAELVHVREQHHARARLVALQRRDQIAEPVGARGDAEAVERLGEIPPHAALIAAEAGDQHQLGEQRRSRSSSGVRSARHQHRQPSALRGRAA